ncbi:MAG: GAF domain-containing protein [Acidobacteriales bacterium]|nr:GAF domain-containing protein [Terriglobales bacterium]
MTAKPILDEASFDRLLEAAFVVQQHLAQERAISNVSAAGPREDFNDLLAEIVETQTLIQLQQLDLPATMKLVGERARSMTGAAGAAIGTIEGGHYVYAVTSGTLADSVGRREQVNDSVCADALQRGKAMEISDVAGRSGPSPSTHAAAGTRSLIAVPILREGKVGGALELHFTEKKDLRQQLRACQLLAGLITDAMNRAAEHERQRGLEAERASVLETLSKLQPQLERLAAPAPAASEPAPPPAKSHPKFEPSVDPTPLPAVTAPEAKPLAQQSSWAAAWKTRAGKEVEPTPPVHSAVPEPPSATPPAREIPKPRLDAEPVTLPPLTPYPAKQSDVVPQGNTSKIEAGAPAPPTSLEPAAENETLARNYVEPEWHPEPLVAPSEPPAQAMEAGGSTLAEEAEAPIFPTPTYDTDKLRDALTRHLEPAAAAAPGVRVRANLYLVIAVLLFAFVAVSWIARRGPAGQGKTTGSAAVNTAVKVWADVAQARYYCAGDPSFGKTPGGRLMTQGEAREAHYKSASHTTCP